MSVRKRPLPPKKNGQITHVWEATVGSKDKRLRKNFATKREADAWEADMTAQLNAGTTSVAGQKMTVAEFWPIYDRYLLGRVARGEKLTRSSYDGINGVVRNFLLATDEEIILPKGSRRVPFHKGLGSLKLGQVTSGKVEKFKEDLREAGVSVSQTRKIGRLCHTFFERARKLDYIRINPFTNFRVDGRRDEGMNKVVPPMPSFIKLMLETATSHRVLLFAFTTTGLRSSEMFALRWRHIDFEKGFLRVETRVDARYRTEELKTKTESGVRRIPLSDRANAILQDHRAQSRFSNTDDLVFPNERGNYIDAGNWNDRWFKPLLAQVNATLPPGDRYEPPKVGFHILRHFAISSWIAQNLPIKTVSTYAGHSSIQVTMDRYGHLFPSDDQSVALNRIADDLGF